MTHQLWVIGGVCGSGKSTVSKALAQTIPSALYMDADDYHSNEAKQRMSSGQGLTESDRTPWLIRIAEAVDQKLSNSNQTLFLACSVLKKAHRDVLRQSLPQTDVHFVILHTRSTSLLESRLQERDSHFAGPTLLNSQLATLELPEEMETDCRVVWIDGKTPIDLGQEIRLQILQDSP